MKRITVFCGSCKGNETIYTTQAQALGQTLVQKNIELVYGGGNIGLMGVIADSVLEAGGKVIGVIPQFLKTKEVAHSKLSELIVVKTMHERKAKMNELTDGVMALPGGFGTLDELFEMLTWSQLGIHSKPIAILNIDGFYDKLMEFIKSLVDHGFLKKNFLDMLLVSDKIDDLLQKMETYQSPNADERVNLKLI